MKSLRYEDGSVQPRYSSYCISNVIPTLLSVLDVELRGGRLPQDVFDGVDSTGVENVVLLVFDGFGFNEWERQVGEGFFGRMASAGCTRPVTSVFPSTTSTALTTLTTGLTPQEHSLIEWFMYLPEADMIIQSLPFAPMGGRGSGMLSSIDPRILVTGDSLIPRLVEQGVAARSYLGRHIARSWYSELMHGAGEIHPYTETSDLAVTLRKRLESERGPSFHYVYVSSIDTLEHLYGPNSEEVGIEAASVSSSLKRGVLDRLDRQVAAKTLFAVTADHGHVFTSPEATTWLDEFGELVKNFAGGRTGRQMLPWGAPRDVYLRVRDDVLDEMYTYLSEVLGERALVVRTADAIASGIFGAGTPNPVFLQRVGNLMILPTDKLTVWYRHPGVKRVELLGQHGGMHADEMTVPLSIARASSVVD